MPVINSSAHIGSIVHELKDLSKLVLSIKNNLKNNSTKNSKPLCLFITGTDTDVGKTYCSVKLLEILKSEGLKTIGLKPLSSGAIFNPDSKILENQDALELQQAASVLLPYSEVNPLAFEPAIAPHIAAKLKNMTLTAQDLFESTQKVIQKYSTNIGLDIDLALIEGVGGWQVPLNAQETMADYVELLSESFEIKIILIIGMKLGCLNHGILTALAIQNSQIGEFLGIITNPLQEEMPYLAENIQMIRDFF